MLSTGLLATAIEQASDMVVVTDTSGRIIYVNPAFEQVTGFPRAEVVGQSPHVWKSGRHSPEFYRELWETLKAGHVWRGEFVNRRRDGTLYRETATISPVRDEKGTVVNYVAVKQDVTEERRVQQELAQSQRMEALGRLAGGIAHDFNNLLTVISTYSELLLGSLSDADPRREDAQHIRDSGRRAAALVRHLLAFSKHDHAPSSVVAVDVVVQELARILSRVLREDIRLSVRPGAANAHAAIDRGELEQVLLNLVLNARDAMPDGGDLRIETRLVDGHVEIAVADTGIGMDPCVRERIFEPFFTTKARGKGTGLGLSTVYGIVTKHDGRVRVVSEPRVGTCFEIRFPVAGDGPRESAPPVTIPSTPGRETVLVVEDEPSIRAAARRVLASNGYRVLVAEDGAAAEQIAAREEIDLLLTDVVMPGMGGRELAERLSGLPVLFMSGYAEGPEGPPPSAPLLGKPFGADELLRAVRRVLDAV